MTPVAPLLTTSEVARVCNVKEAAVLGWVKSGRLAAITLPGGHKRFRREDVEQMLTPSPVEGAA
jgi:excisionase family DNA binding protein